jgi:hypothetical protein
MDNGRASTKSHASAASAGYSGTPLAAKLGIRAGDRVALIGAPDGYRAWLGELPGGVTFTARVGSEADLAHVFVTRADELTALLADLRRRLPPHAAVWVSWPKKASKVPTTVTEDVIRSAALPLGFVDVKVCAVSAVWSALKLVVRKELR